MSTITNDRIAGMLTEEAKGIRRDWGWFLALGIVQIVAGMLAVTFAFSPATLASVAMLGILLLIAAGAQTGAVNLGQGLERFPPVRVDRRPLCRRRLLNASVPACGCGGPDPHARGGVDGGRNVSESSSP